MTNEEKKAIKEVKNIIEEVTENTKQEIPTYIFDRDIKCLPIVLNLIKTQDKMIDYMAMRIKGCVADHHNKNISKKEIKKQFYMIAKTETYIDKELEKSRKKVEEDDKN